jgi:hypothetical protein
MSVTVSSEGPQPDGYNDPNGCLVSLDNLIVHWTDALVAPEYKIEGWHGRPVGPFAGTAWGYMVIIESLQHDLATLEDAVIHHRKTPQDAADQARGKVHAAVLEIRGKHKGQRRPYLRRRFFQPGQRPAAVELGSYLDNVRQMAKEVMDLCERCDVEGRQPELRVVVRADE